MQTITFMDMIKLVHPDHAIKSEYASHERAVLVLRHRDNPKKLEKLAREWGIIAATQPWKISRRVLKVGDMIDFLVCRDHGTIVVGGLVVDMVKSRNEYVAIVIDTTGKIWRFNNRLLQVFKVRFKFVCDDMSAYILKAKAKSTISELRKRVKKG